MPYSIRPPRTRTFIAGLTAALLSICVLPAFASAGCPTTKGSQIFSKFGDSAEYSLASGGSFESATSGWTLSHAAVGNENESYSIAGGKHDLAIEANGSAVSPAICVNSEYPYFRFFARRTGGSWGVLNVIVRWTDSSKTTHETTSAAIQSGTSWTLTPILQLGSMLPVSSSNSVSVQLVFKPEPYGGPWAIDDVYVDPYRK